VAGTLAALALVLGIVLLVQGDGGESDRRAEVSDVSERFALALTSYDYRHLDDDFGKVKAMSTSGYADEFDDLLGGQQLAAALKKSRARSVSSVQKGPFIATVSDDEARTVTVVEQRVTNQEQPEARPVRIPVQLYLVRLASGGWKVADVTTE
jgi:hypothetical protein